MGNDCSLMFNNFIVWISYNLCWQSFCLHIWVGFMGRLKQFHEALKI